MSGSTDEEQGVLRTKKAPPGQATLVTIGNFDGVHRGHAALLDRVVHAARASQLTPMVLTFEPHPNAVLGRDVPPLLTSLERKLELLARVAPGLQVAVEPFTAKLARWSPEEFAERLLSQAFAARSVIVGEGFRFGARRSGELSTLQLLGKRLGFGAQSAPLETEQAKVISSTRIRRALADGDVAGARALLGRPHSVSGEVVRGEQFARKLGVPSANLAHVREQLPGHGVYSVLVDLRGPGREGRFARLGTGVANVGVRPTGGSGALRLEVHVHDYTGDLYGRRLRVHFAGRLREERRFEGRSALVAQLQQDVVRSRAELLAHRADPNAEGAWH